jgi:hypothetical protein
MLRKVRITSVSQRSRIVTQLSSTVTRLCDQCSQTNIMVTAPVASAISDLSLRMICRLVEAGQVHYSEGAEGLFICLSSLPGD